MLRAKPNPYPWLVAAAVTALVVGSLFRGYSQTHVGFLRMFGTIGLVFIGYFATRTFYAIQEGEALDRLHQALAGLPSDFHVGSSLTLKNPEGRGRLVVDLTLLGPNGVHLLAIDTTRPFVKKDRALVHWSRKARHLWRAQRAIAPRLARLGSVPVGGLVLALYRDDAMPAIEGLPLLTVETLAQRLPGVHQDLSAEPLDPETYDKLRQLLLNPAQPSRADRPAPK